MTTGTTKAIILVGGDTRGTRFRPLSLDVPKPLFPIAGKPLLAHIIESLSELPSLKEIFLIGFYEESIFKDFLSEIKRSYPNIIIKYLREYKAMGTAGGLFHFRDEIKRNSPDNFFVIHADIICNFPFKEILEFYNDKNNYYNDLDCKTVIMGISKLPQNNEKSAENFGTIVSDLDDKVVHYVEKPESKVSNLINGGIYLFDSKYIINKIAKQKLKKEVLSNDDYHAEFVDSDVVSLEHDILSNLPDDESFFVYKTKSYWRQVKNPGSALIANELRLQDAYQKQKSFKTIPSSSNIIQPVFIDPSTVVSKTAKIGPFVSIGPNTFIADGVRIKNSIILDGVNVKPNACILNSIISNNSTIGKWARIEGTKIHVDDLLTYIEQNGVKFNKACILSSDSHVNDDIYVKNCVVLPNKSIKSDVKYEVVM
ncbi:mannose-1-phosphate guanylyltransferase [Ascoidea rubescens DSM 1968]|uniref:mannose-1-phosphate guanylyltransferase n=1 Tax=Ascoidea rubescens DSM 1968 TaxID=1344418 RepID=A0A1D2VLE5_9ASCO|nr:nucleotide-diphospho-sugar transferase [Ascoidea rubescens DSM 1968]ODV62429.1 nucleotide-diphospho-sugar transferase [Ascoidea rubescens DSM 1968]